MRGAGSVSRIRRALLTLACLLALIVAGCGQQNGTATAPEATEAAGESPPAAAATTEAAGESSPAATATTQAPTVVPEGSFANPVYTQNFPDPHVIRVDGTFYAFATNGSGRNVQTAESTDLVRWRQLPDAMPALPRWVRLSNPDVWAPEVIDIDGRYLLYYTARDKESGRQCIGVAESDQPQGRYTHPSDTPLICQVDQGGSIDANPFRDEDGTLYLYWKNDGNCCGMATWIYVQELAPDGLSLVGEPIQLTRNDRRWEGPVVEAPTMWRQDDDYVLFYSGNGYAGLEYAVGYAMCESPAGPCEEAEENPILKTSLERPPVIGPGHQTVVTDDEGQTWLVYHAWEISTSGTKTDRRFMWIDRLEWEDGRPVVRGPTTEPQPVPAIDE
jgi:beta-xylosidase